MHFLLHQKLGNFIRSSVNMLQHSYEMDIVVLAHQFGSVLQRFQAYECKSKYRFELTERKIESIYGLVFIWQLLVSQLHVQNVQSICNLSLDRYFLPSVLINLKIIEFVSGKCSLLDKSPITLEIKIKKKEKLKKNK